jgi:signal transduction histidine kinase
MALDFAVAAVAALFAMLVLASPFFGQSRYVPLADVLLAALVFFPVALRRRGPVAAFGVLVTVAAVVANGVPTLSVLVFLAAAYVLYLVTTTCNRQTGGAALALALIVMVLIVLAERELGHIEDAGVYVPVAFATVIAWMTGYSVRQRRLYAQTLQDQAASSAVAEERLRIARELHDVVAHSMSVIAVQAGYGQYVIDSSPADAREALGAIQATSRDALEEMRRMLGVLRQQDVAQGTSRAHRAPLGPAPGLSGLDRLIQRTCGAGVQVSVERSGRVRAVPAGVDLSAYRIIQEALTNVVRHAGGGARCAVSLGYGDAALEVRVTDDGGLSHVLTPAGIGAASGAGHGIIGMRERANLCGGEFSAGPLPEGGFQVTAVLPLLKAGGTDEDVPAIGAIEAATAVEAVEAVEVTAGGGG